MHNLRELNQADRRGELGIFHRRRYAPGRLGVGQVGRYFKNFSGEMIDAAQNTASARNEDTGAEITEIRFFFESALEQLERFAQAEVNDCVQRFALDLFSRKTGIVLKQNHFARKTVSKDATSLFDF